jgi:putative hydrolase of the HAD superfamily
MKICPVEATLRSLHSAGLRLFVLSNNDERLYSILDGLGIGRYFEAVFVSAELGAEKPSNRIFEFVQEWIKVEPQKILHVGDNPQEDVQGAMRAGWHAALVGTSALTSNITADYRQASSIHDLFFAE